ncbi:expressed protein [Phakopsora pachyrhizi]|uniref:Expressed protein n=1 Tax=Phakopsora pachyrhizi TaxID=170000 RepID=A0AAV0AX52_PHAPC|nr:expressed protein [Phakopsora pachyrhizi]
MYLTSSNQAQERHMHSLNQQRQAPHDINMNSPRRPPSQQRTNHVRNFSSTTQGPYSSSLGHFPTPGSSDMPSQSFPGAPNSIIPPSLPDPKSMVFLQKPPQPQNFTNNQAGYPVGVGGPNYAQKINPPNNASGLLGTLNPSLVQQHPEHKNDGSLTSNSYDNLNMPSQHPEKQQNPSQMVNQRFSPLRPTAGSFEKPQLGQADVATNSAFCKVASSKPQSLVQEQQLNSASQKFFNVQPPSLPHSQNNVNPNSNQNLSQNSAQHVQMSSHTFQPGQAPLSDAAKARPASYSMQGAQNFKFPGNPGGVQPTIPMPQADQNQFNQFPRYQPAHSSSHLMSTNLNQPNNSLNNGRPLPPQQQQQYIPGLPLTNNSPRLQHIGEQNSPS